MVIAAYRAATTPISASVAAGRRRIGVTPSQRGRSLPSTVHNVLGQDCLLLTADCRRVIFGILDSTDGVNATTDLIVQADLHPLRLHDFDQIIQHAGDGMLLVDAYATKGQQVVFQRA